MFFSIKESYETTLLRRQKDRLEQAKMEKEAEERKLRETEEEEKRKKQSKGSGSAVDRSAVAKPGANDRKKRFMPKKRGRLGL